MIVEDELAIQQMYKQKLEIDGFEVHVAGNGELGLLQASTLMPDIILLDLRMPIMAGDEMLAKLRGTTWGSGIRVIILTNISRDEAPSALRFLNVDRYIVKAHHTPSQVVGIVREVLGHAGAG